MFRDRAFATLVGLVSIERSEDALSVVLRVTEEGAVVGIEGDGAALAPGLRFGVSAFDVCSPSMSAGLQAAIASAEPTRFRAVAQGREWLCTVEPASGGLVVSADRLPGTPTRLAHSQVGSFIDDAPFHVSVADARERGRLLVWNQASESMFGYTAQEALHGLTARDLYVEESDFLAMLAAVEDGIFDRECTMRRKDDSTFVGRVLVLPKRDATRTVVERCTFVEDLTQAKLAERADEEAHRTAGHDDRVRLMGQLAGGIAHDFNNLLTAIMSSAELLEIQCGAMPSATEDLKVITSAARSASSLTRRLLTFTRNKVEAPRRIDVATWFRELLPFLSRLVPERVRFEHELQGEGTIEIDPNELEQVVLNLVVNAVGAMPEGGVLTLRCSCLDNRMLLEVEDTGVGMAADLQERVFEPFFTTRAEGTGLGLSTARAIVRRAGGEIWVLSAADSGSCFSVSVPLCECVVPGPRQPERPATQSQPSRGVALLVEDQSDVRYAVERLLNSMGYDVRAEPDVRGGKHALEEMAECSLLLTDYMLPDGTGMDLIEDARAIFPDAHAVLMSGYLQELQAADESFDRLIAKPFTRSQLSELLSDLVAGEQAPDRAAAGS